jgi:hypothetical protein
MISPAYKRLKTHKTYICHLIFGSTVFFIDPSSAAIRMN